MAPEREEITMKLSISGNKIMLQNIEIAHVHSIQMAKELVKRWNIIEGYKELAKVITDTKEQYN